MNPKPDTALDAQKDALPPPPRFPRKRAPRNPMPSRAGCRGGPMPPGTHTAGVVPPEVVENVAVEMTLGASAVETAQKYQITPGQAARIQRIAGISPVTFYAELGRRFSAILETAAERMQEKLDRGEGNVRDLTFVLSMITDKVQDLNGVSKPAVVSQTNIQINGFSRDDLRQYLLDGKVPTQRNVRDDSAAHA